MYLHYARTQCTDRTDENQALTNAVGESHSVQQDIFVETIKTDRAVGPCCTPKVQ